MRTTSQAVSHVIRDVLLVVCLLIVGSLLVDSRSFRAGGNNIAAVNSNQKVSSNSSVDGSDEGSQADELGWIYIAIPLAILVVPAILARIFSRKEAKSKLPQRILNQAMMNPAPELPRVHLVVFN